MNESMLLVSLLEAMPVVIGGGTAGLVTAAGAAGLGATVALVERQLLGGAGASVCPLRQ